MKDMLATIDDITAAKVDADRKVHGAGYLRVLADGSTEHVPLEMLPGEISARELESSMEAANWHPRRLGRAR